MNFRKVESRQDLIGDNPEQRKLRLRNGRRDAALQMQQFLPEERHLPRSESVHTKNRRGLWVTVANQVDVLLNICLLNSYSWNTNKPTPPPAHSHPCHAHTQPGTEQLAEENLSQSLRICSPTKQYQGRMDSMGILSMEIVNNCYSRTRGGKGMAISAGAKVTEVLLTRTHTHTQSSFSYLGSYTVRLPIPFHSS